MTSVLAPLPRNEVAVAKIHFHAHLAQCVLALRHGADGVILQAAARLGEAVDRLERSVHRAVADAGVLKHSLFFGAAGGGFFSGAQWRWGRCGCRL